MSTVVVVRKAKQICIAADTQTSYGDLVQPAAYLKDMTKILRVGDTYIGLVGSSSHVTVLQHYFARRKKTASFKDCKSIFNVWLELHAALKAQFHLNSQDEKDDPYETTRISALLANPHGIFGVYPMREVDEYTKFWAKGSGDEYALGAMHACYSRLKTAEEIARVGVEAAAEFDSGTALPLTLHSISLK